MIHDKITWNAQLYDQNHSFVAEYGKGLVELLAPKQGERILDIGCGTGALTAEIANNGAIATGIDSSGDMIAKAKTTYPEVHFEIGDATNFHFDAPFDALFSNATLHWVTQKEKAVQQFYKHLTPNGRLVVEFGGKDNVHALTTAVKQAARQVVGKEVNTDFWYFPSLGEYTTLLEKQGFRVAQAFHYARPTELSGPDGIKNWFRMFGELILKGMTKEEVEEILESTQNQLKPLLFIDEKWFADYKRLRIVAVKE